MAANANYMEQVIIGAKVQIIVELWQLMLR